MKITKIIAIACATFALVACGGEAEESSWNEADTKTYTDACVKGGAAEADCKCYATEMGKTVAFADGADDAEEANKTKYTEAETKAKETCAKDGEEEKKS